jgi:IS1 family transposase
LADSSSVVVAVWGTRYQPYIARWWESLKTLNRQPNEIVLVSDLADDSNLFSTIPDWVDVPVVKVQIDSDQYNELWSAAVHAASQEWIVKLCIDDQFCPQALDFLETVEGDLVIDRCRFLQGGEWVASWDTNDTDNRRFAPASFSPFRRNLIQFYDKIPKLCLWDDYVFYLLLAKANVKVYRTDNYRMIHDLGVDHETVSGYNRNADKAVEANRILDKVRRELEL